MSNFVGARLDLDETYAWAWDELHRLEREMVTTAGKIKGGASVEEARELLDPATGSTGSTGSTGWPAEPSRGPRPERRFTADELRDLLPDCGLRLREVQGVRVFADLVPSSLLDLEPGAASALLELERAVSTRPDYLVLASQLHVLATR